MVEDSHLLQISVAKLRSQDPVEIARLMEVTTTIGFFYAVDHGADKELMKKLRD